MFRSSTILRELVQSLHKVIFLSKLSIKLRQCILCGDVAAFPEMACVLFVVQTAVCTTTSPHNIQRRNFTECFDRNVTLASFVQASWGWSKTETCRSDNYVYSSVKLNFSKFNKNAVVGEWTIYRLHTARCNDKSVRTCKARFCTVSVLCWYYRTVTEWNYDRP